MDSQIVFNYVTDHLARQKAPAIDTKRICMLRGYNGTKCAIGCLIPDSDYVSDMEDDSGIGSDINTANDEDDGFMHAWLKHTLAPTQDQYALLGKLQRCHDCAMLDDDPVEGAKTEWPVELQSTAKEFGLEFDRVSFENNLRNPSYK